MTGFGRATASNGTRRLSVEIRSVNHRGLDLKVRGRDIDAACEVEIIRAVRMSVARGAVTLSLRDESGDLAVLNVDRLRSLHALLTTVRQQLNIGPEIDLATLAAFLVAVPNGHIERAPEWSWDAVRPAVEEALDALGAMRAREGAILVADLRQRLDLLETLAAQVAERAAPLAEQSAHRLRERLRALTDQPGFDAGRLAQEAAFLAEKLDVSEEVVRLGAHLAHLRALLDEGSQGGAAGARAAASGRKLDFLVQEVGRELNTIATKVQDAGIAALVIEGKTELEKIREQAQNIE